MYSIADSLKTIDNYKIDLSGYATKTDTVSKSDLNELKAIVANKLDSNPVNHTHSIQQITELETKLSNKLNVPSTEDSKYSYNTLLKDWSKIPFLENVKVPLLDITNDKTQSGYILSVDSTGDLLITLNDSVIASYNKVAGTWIFNGTDLNSFIKSTNEVLKNHYDTIIYMLEVFHGMTDDNKSDGNLITPTLT